MVERDAKDAVIQLAKSFKAVALTGPRQSGKTTLLREMFPEKSYLSLENPQERQFALTDPVQFLKRFPQGAILDEVQRAPDLFSYLQQILDESTEHGKFVLSGSNNFLLLESITQSLAGRVGYLELLPFSYRETMACPSPPTSWLSYLFQGGYPAVAHDQVSPSLWFPSYVRTYIERDVRQIRNISDILQFQRLLQACAGRIGQQVNFSSLGNDIGIDYKTVQSWISIMQASYIIFLLPPFYKNFNKRVVKAPKLYFHDTGLASYLLGITKSDQVMTHPFKGPLFENLVILECLKNRLNKGQRNNLFYYRDSAGNEVDLIIDHGITQTAVEIKSAETLSKDFLKGLLYWEKLTGTKEGKLIYGGESVRHSYEGFEVMNWKSLPEV
ncbi:MAG TPA: ATP-binding protein [Chryseosolibacter sp.]|nr:ATP-binding protein [Chryseosolibacter sp.]